MTPAVTPDEPAAPAALSASAAPAAPAAPAALVDPAATVDPAALVAPAAPVDPIAPASPITPVIPHIALVAITRQGLTQATALARLLQTEDTAAGMIDIHVPEKFAGMHQAGTRVLPYSGPLSDQVGPLFAACDQLVFFVSLGAVTRLIAPHLKSKHQDPGVLVIDEAGRFVIPALSGHVGGANAFAERIAALIGATAVITTASDVGQTLAVDLLGREFGWRLEAPKLNVTRVSAQVVNGEPIALIQECGRRDWWRRDTPLPANIHRFDRLEDILDPERYGGLLWITRRDVPPKFWTQFAERLVVYRPPEQERWGADTGHTEPQQRWGADTGQTDLQQRTAALEPFTGFGIDTAGPLGSPHRLESFRQAAEEGKSNAVPSALAPSPLAGEGWGEGEGNKQGNGHREWDEKTVSPPFFLGLGCDRDTELETLAEAVRLALAQCGAHPDQVAGVATIDRKGDEPAILALASRHSWPLRLYSAAELAQVPVPNPSATVLAHMGTPAVAEAAALLAAGSSPPLPDPPPPGGRESGSLHSGPRTADQKGLGDPAILGRAALVLEKFKFRGPDGKNATVSIARPLPTATEPNARTEIGLPSETDIPTEPSTHAVHHRSLASANNQPGNPPKYEIQAPAANAPLKGDDAHLAERKAQLKGDIHLAEAETLLEDDLHPIEPVAPPKASVLPDKPIAPSPRQGKLSLVSLGPGNPEHMTLRARQAIAEAEVVIGYGTYLKLIPELLVGKEVIRKGMTEELDRGIEAYEQARLGRRVALVSSGDIGVYGMAGPTYEVLLQAGWRPGAGVEVELVPGCTALATCASLVGAPLTHDFCAISLSDLLTPWPVIARRLEAAARGDFVIALYNPKSGKRTGQVLAAQRILLRHRAPETPVAIVKAAYREEQATHLSRLDAFADCPIGMLSTVLIGNSSTFVREGLMVTPRGYANKYEDLTGAAKAGERAGRSLSQGLEGWQAAIRDYRREHPEASVEELAQRFDGPVEEILAVIHGTVDRDGGI